jgi:hypothetical protein
VNTEQLQKLWNNPRLVWIGIGSVTALAAVAASSGRVLTWRATPEVWGLAMLAAGDAAAFQSGWCPSLFTVRTFRAKGAHAERTAGDIRLGMTLGSGMALVVGFGASYVGKSWWPLAFTIGALGLFWGVYEWALANPANVHQDIASQ